MKTIARLKDSFSKDLRNLNINPHYIGLKVFQIGVLFLEKTFLILAFTIVASCLGLQPTSKIKSESSIPLIEELNE